MRGCPRHRAGGPRPEQLAVTPLVFGRVAVCCPARGGGDDGAPRPPGAGDDTPQGSRRARTELTRLRQAALLSVSWPVSKDRRPPVSRASSPCPAPPPALTARLPSRARPAGGSPRPRAPAAQGRCGEGRRQHGASPLRLEADRWPHSRSPFGMTGRAGRNLGSPWGHWASREEEGGVSGALGAGAGGQRHLTRASGRHPQTVFVLTVKPCFRMGRFLSLPSSF